MNIKPGILLISAPLLDDPNFEKVVVFITEYNKKGAMGFVINKLFPRRFNELTEFKNSPAMPLFDGGPVETECLFFVHGRPDLIEGGTVINDDIYLGGNFKQAVQHMDNKIISDKEIKLFIGYCGWDPGQLEEEIAEGTWLVSGGREKNIFTNDITTSWDYIYNKAK